jgi:hypothetical protein
MIDDPLPRPKKRARRSARPATAILFVLSICLALATIEGLTRLFFPAFDPSGRFDFDYPVGTLVLGRPGTEARQAKNTGDYDVAVSINRHGLRDANDISRATADDLVIVGDSVAWGWGIEEGLRFSNLVEAMTGIRTFNLSAPTDIEGYASLLRYAQSLGARIGRVIVAVSMETDIGLYEPPPPTASPASHPRLPAVKTWLQTHSAAYIFATSAIHQTAWLNALAVRMGLIIPNLEGIPPNDDIAQDIESSADKLKAISDRYSTLAVLVPSRGLWVGSNRVAEDRVHRALVAALARRGIEVLDLRPLFERGGAPLSLHFANDGHWNPRGHRLAAEAIVDRLRAHGRGDALRR